MSSPVMLLLAVASPFVLAALLWLEGIVQDRLGEPRVTELDLYDAVPDHDLARAPDRLP